MSLYPLAGAREGRSLACAGAPLTQVKDAIACAHDPAAHRRSRRRSPRGPTTLVTTFPTDNIKNVIYKYISDCYYKFKCLPKFTAQGENTKTLAPKTAIVFGTIPFSNAKLIQQET